MHLQATRKAELFIALPASELLLFMHEHMISMSTGGSKSFMTVTTPEYSLMKISMMIVPISDCAKSMCTGNYNALIVISVFISLQSVYSDLEHRTYSTSTNLL